MAGDKIYYKGDWVVNLSKNFLFNCNLSLQARSIFTILKSFASPNRPEVFPSIKLLAKITGFNRDTVYKYLNELIKKGHVLKTQSRNTEGEFSYNIYTLIEDLDSFNSQNTVTEKSGHGNSGTKKSQSINKFSPDSIEVQLSETLYRNIKERNPKHKQPNIQNWARHIDLMIRIDSRTPADIEEAMRLAQKHEFWYKVILSTAKLRKHFDRLILEKDSRFNDGHRVSDGTEEDLILNGDATSYTRSLLNGNREAVNE